MGANLFLSYGHRDAGDLAARLRTALEQAGYTVWQDVDGIRVAQGWSGEIADALRASDVVVALLSPHAVRRAVDPANPDGKDSVCIDEIEYAVDAAGIPVVPIMVKTCEPPFRIFRLQYLDFRGWAESDARYEALVEQLVGALDTALETGHSPTRTWGFLPEPWDFSAFLIERRNRFMGRDWLFEAIEVWRRDAGSRSMLLVGGPGVGKSAIVAQLIHENPDGQVLAYHCCQADTPATLSAATFVRSLSGQLSSRVEGYASALKTPEIRAALDSASVESDPASAFEAGVLAPLTALPAPEGGAKYLLVDALDEALLIDEGLNVSDLLVTRLSRFPPWLRLVATTRPEPKVLRKFRGLAPHMLDAEDPRNRADVLAFTRHRLEDPQFDEAVAQADLSREEVADLLLEVSAGNFLYVRQALDAVREGHLSISEVAELPPGLGSLYEVFFDRLFARAGVPFESARRVLEAIVASLEPASRAELAAVTGLDEQYEVPKILGRLASFVPARSGRYTVFHASVTEWLTGWDADLDQPITEDYHVSPVAGHALWAAHLLGRYDEGARLDAVVVQRLPTHLAGARRWDDLAGVLTNWRFLEAKAHGAASSVFDLLADFNLASASMPADHTHAALLRLLGEILHIDGQFIAQHPDTLFQCCWNRGYWHDSPLAADYLERADKGNEAETALWTFVERWRAERAAASKTPWVRYLRPPVERLGSAQRSVLVGHTDALKHVAVAPDGTRLVSADGEDDANVKLWDVASGSELLTRDLGDGQDVQGIRFTPDGAHLVAAHWNGMVSMLDAGTLETTATLRVAQGPLSGMALSADGRWAAISDWGGTLRVVDLETWTIARSAKVVKGRIEGVAFSPDGDWIAAGDGGSGRPNEVVLCRRASLDVEQRFSSEASITAVTFSPDGTRLVWSDYKGRVFLHHLASGAQSTFQDAAVRDHFGRESVAPVGALCFLGSRLLVGTAPVWGSADILVWDTESREMLHRLPGHQFGVSALAPIDETTRFASAGDSTVRVWDLGRIAGSAAVPREQQVTHLHFADAVGAVITGAVQNEHVWVRSVEDGSLIHLLDGHALGVHAVALGPGGRFLVCGTGNGGVRVWDLTSGALRWANEPHEDLVGAVALSEAAAVVASGSNDGTVCVQKIEDPGPPLVLPVEDWPQQLAFSPAGDRLGVAGLSSIQMWDAVKGDLVWRVDRPDSTYGLLFLEDGLILVGVGEELRELDVISGTEKDVPEAHRDAWLRRVGYADRTWAWLGTLPAGRTRKEINYSQYMAELIRCDTGRSVAWLPLLMGAVHYYPNRPIWANQRGDSAWVFRLEDGEADGGQRAGLHDK